MYSSPTGTHNKSLLALHTRVKLVGIRVLAPIGLLELLFRTGHGDDVLEELSLRLGACVSLIRPIPWRRY